MWIRQYWISYASAIWSPYLVKHINKLESIQRFGARFITGKYDKTCSVSALLRDLQLPRMELRRISGSLRKFGSTWTAGTDLSTLFCIKCMGLYYTISLTFVFLLAKS